MQAWIVWLVVAALLAIAELFIGTLDLLLLAGAAAVAAGAGLAGLPPGLTLLVFGLSAGAAMGVVRPLVRKHIRQAPALRSGTAALVGSEAITLTEVNRMEGLVRIGGEDWSARPYDRTLVIPEGTTVDVLAIEGAYALVYPREEPL